VRLADVIVAILGGVPTSLAHTYDNPFMIPFWPLAGISFLLKISILVAQRRVRDCGREMLRGTVGR
jgi:hypothetical protein